MKSVYDILKMQDCQVKKLEDASQYCNYETSRLRAVVKSRTYIGLELVTAVLRENPS